MISNDYKLSSKKAKTHSSLMRQKSLLSMAMLLGVYSLFGLTPLKVNASEHDHPDTFRVLVWNVWRGTNGVDDGPEKALQLIKESKADICLLQESYDIEGERPQFGPWAAKELGWNAWQGKSRHLCVISRYKIKKTFFYSSMLAIGAELEDDKGRTLHAFSTWINWKSHIGTYLMENPNCTDADLLASETRRSKRFVQTKAILDYLKEQQLTSLQTPLLVGGDWNCPSHLDWTQGTSEAFPFRRPLPLPISKEMEAAGFNDVFRAIYH